MNNITIDIRLINSSGIGTYIKNLIPRIILEFPEDKFNLIGCSEKIRKMSWSNNNNVSIIECMAPIYSLKEQYELIKIIPKDTTLFWSPHYNIPILYNGKLLVTVHDVFHLAMRHYVGGLHKRLYAKTMFKLLRYKADAILCVSKFTEDELTRYTGKGKQQIFITYNGVDDSWFMIKRKFKLNSNPYLLYVGNIKPHKNLANLIDAFEIIKNKIPHDLVIVGKKEGFITEDKKIAIKATSLGERVRFTGYVEEELLRQYLIYADALVFPSLYEGFGLPPLEAMASGCPTIVSDVASLPEICGDAALYCNPYSPKDIAEKILLLINNKELKESLREKGLARAKNFTWDKCAKETITVIKKVLNQ